MGPPGTRRDQAQAQKQKLLDRKGLRCPILADHRALRLPSDRAHLAFPLKIQGNAIYCHLRKGAHESGRS